MNEKKFFGRNACRALWEKRRSDIIRVYLKQELLKEFAELVRFCVETKLAYHVVPEAELSKVTQSTHHEGICILARVLKPRTFAEIEPELRSYDAAVLYLEGVENPHNIGAIARVCAFFGIRYLLSDSAIPDGGSAARVAEGGLELVTVARLDSPRRDLRALCQSGYELVAAAPAGETNLFDIGLARRTVFLVGSEQHGLTSETLALAAHRVALHGTGAVQSLSVVTASAIFVAEYSRQHPG